MPVAAGPAAERSAYRGYRFPLDIIVRAGWLYFRFHLSLRDVQDLRVERGIIGSHESIHHWCTKFGAVFAAELRRRRARAGDMWHLDDERFLRQVLESEDGNKPRVVIIDQLRSYPRPCDRFCRTWSTGGTSA